MEPLRDPELPKQSWRKRRKQEGSSGGPALRLWLAVQGTQVRSLSWEDPKCSGPTEPAPQVLKPEHREPELLNREATTMSSPAGEKDRARPKKPSKAGGATLPAFRRRDKARDKNSTVLEQKQTRGSRAQMREPEHTHAQGARTHSRKKTVSPAREPRVNQWGQSTVFPTHRHRLSAAWSLKCETDTMRWTQENVLWHKSQQSFLKSGSQGNRNKSKNKQVGSKQTYTFLHSKENHLKKKDNLQTGRKYVQMMRPTRD